MGSRSKTINILPINLQIDHTSGTDDAKLFEDAEDDAGFIRLLDLNAPVLRVHF